MFKNSGNINYFQKNKKILLSLIGVGFLTGAAVTEKVVPSQEISDAINIRADENLRIPPHPVGLQDKLSRIKSETMSLTALTNGFNYLGTIDGYTVEYRSFTLGSDVVYQFLGTSGASQLGFACICSSVTGTKTWKGMNTSLCATANPNVAIPLNSQIMGIYSMNVAVPNGACCKSVPRVGLTNIPGISSFCGG